MTKKRCADDQEEEQEDGMHRCDARLRQVSKALSAVEPPGSFATTGSHGIFPLPMINVDGCGPVPVPLTDATAKELIAQCHLAPYGLREQTLVDTSVRNTWELNTAQFKIDNPAWQPFVDAIVEASRVPLGLPATATVAAKLYKLLLYEAGGKFDQHQDSEKERGMFGTLVVVLPGVFTGGELVVHDPSTASTHISAVARDDTTHTIVCDAGSMDPFAVKYAAFYGDCPHEVLPVNSGYRLCLTYNLVTVVDDATTTTATEPTFNRNHALYASLKTALCEFFTDDSNAYVPHEQKKPRTSPRPPTLPFNLKDPLTHRATKLVYVLNHKYTEESLAPAFLKNKDALVASSLSQFCRESDGMLELYLCSLEYHFKWSGEPEQRFNKEKLGEHDSLTKLAILDMEWMNCGNTSASVDYILVSGRDRSSWNEEESELCADLESELAPCQYFDDESLVYDRQNESLYTGNEGSLLEKWYSSAALVLLPISHRVLWQWYSNPVETLTTVWLPMVKTNPVLAKKVALTLGETVTDWSLDEEEVQRVLDALHQLKDLEVATAILKSCKNITYQPALRGMARSFTWEQVAVMVADIMACVIERRQRNRSTPTVIPRHEFATSAVNLITSILRCDEDDPAVIASLLEASKLADKAHQFEVKSWSLKRLSVDELARLLRLALRVSPEQFQLQLWADSEEILVDVVSPAARQAPDGHVPDAVRPSLLKLRDDLLAATASAFQRPYNSMSMACPLDRSNDRHAALYFRSFDMGPCATCKTVNVFLKAKGDRSIVVTKGYLADHKLMEQLTATTSPQDSTKIVITKAFEDPRCACIRKEIDALDALLQSAA